jgi:hypothetical protein
MIELRGVLFGNRQFRGAAGHPILQFHRVPHRRLAQERVFDSHPGLVGKEKDALDLGLGQLGAGCTVLLLAHEANHTDYPPPGMKRNLRGRPAHAILLGGGPVGVGMLGGVGQ